MISVMNQPHCHKDNRHRFDTKSTQMFYKIYGVLKGALKNFTEFTGKYLCRVLI